jgi:predicted negative regulator of RcsB-dependent stress response
MKAQHRHELETNALAKRLGVVVERLRPYAPTVIGVVVVCLAGLIGLSYFSGASAARESETWNSYNQAVESLIPNLDRLKQAAEENAGTPAQLWANAAWADGQVWMACRDYIQRRAVAMEELSRAETAYKTLLKSTEDQQLLDRAHFGLGRIYEMRNEPDAARENYLAVRGGFADIAKLRAEKLADQKSRDVYEWLASAQAPRRASPAGSGAPGQRPDFNVGDLDMPSVGKGLPAETPGATNEDLLKGFLPEDGKEPKDRYQTSGDTGSKDAAPAK